MDCTNECFTPRLACVLSATGYHKCTRGNEVHSGLCVCRCGFRWDVGCVFIQDKP